MFAPSVSFVSLSGRSFRSLLRQRLIHRVCRRHHHHKINRKYGQWPVDKVKSNSAAAGPSPRPANDPLPLFQFVVVVVHVYGSSSCCCSCGGRKTKTTIFFSSPPSVRIDLSPKSASHLDDADADASVTAAGFSDPSASCIFSTYSLKTSRNRAHDFSGMVIEDLKLLFTCDSYRHISHTGDCTSNKLTSDTRMYTPILFCPTSK